MRPNQRLVSPDDGYEIMLFPLEYMNISQGEYSSLSHQLAMDFLGWNANGRVYTCPYYAPCSCRCVAHWGSDANTTWESLDLVHTPDGHLTKITFCCQHDNTPLPVGTVLTQGDLMGHTGTAGYVTGDHLHFNVALGNYDGYSSIGGGWYELKNSVHIYNICYTNDTVIYDGENYPWREYQGGVIPPGPGPHEEERHKFPWFLYTNRLRERR